MTLEEFAAVARARIPTPAEFLAFVRGRGWRIGVKDGRGAIWANPADPLVQRTAKMLGREPWRTEVLKLLAAEQAKPYTPAVEPVALPVLPRAAAEDAPAAPTVCRACGANWWVSAAEVREAVNRGPHYCGQSRCPFRDREGGRR
jgi:hypothetical protein